jgi:hypothetical protein
MQQEVYQLQRDVCTERKYFCSVAAHSTCLPFMCATEIWPASKIFLLCFNQLIIKFDDKKYQF